MKYVEFVDMYFITRTATGLNHQGRVLELVGNNHALVEFYSWLDGTNGGYRLVAIGRMVNWEFFRCEKERDARCEILAKRQEPS